MGELVPFHDAQGAGIGRREFEAAVETIIKPLLELQELMRAHAWYALETAEDPHDAVATWQAVSATVRVLRVLHELSPEWHAWASGRLPDGKFFEHLLDEATEKFAPAFVAAMSAGETAEDGDGA